jgi:tetratricopeptide (TPR) repeat protein
MGLDDDPRLNELARLVLDGASIDWAAERTGPSNIDDATLAALRAVSAIVEAHRSQQDERSPAGPQASRATAQPAGATWGPLELIEKIGGGAFADVFRARDPGLDREVALKLLHQEAGESGADASVVEEGRLLAKVRHPHVVTVYGAAIHARRVGIWTELIKGQTLEDILGQRGMFGPREVALTGAELCQALAAVHGANLLHRDVKARNVMRELGGRIVLMDFGMTRALSADALEPPDSGGTPLYMAPEVLDGAPATTRSDVYSLGVLLFHLLTGMYPVSGRTLEEIRQAHRDGDRRSLRALRADLPAALVAVVERTVAPDPGRRFATAADVETALLSTIDAVCDRAASASRKDEASAGRRRRSRLLGAAALAIVLLGLGWGIAQRPTDRPAMAFEWRDWVLVGAFENRTGNVLLDGTVEYALQRELAASQFVNVVTRERVNDTLALMQRPPTTELDPAVGLEVCRRDGHIRVLVTGRVERRGSSYAVIATLVDPNSNRQTPLPETVAALGESGIASALRDLSGSIRVRLGEAAAQIDESAQRLEKVTTPSLRALQLFSQALSVVARNAQQWAVAAQLLEQALEADPNFASAHIYLALALCNAGQPASVFLPHAERALTLSDAASDRERYVIRGAYFGMTGDDEQAIVAFQALLRLYPDDFWGTYNLAVTLERAGRFPEAWELQRHLADLRPRDFNVVAGATLAAFWSGRPLPEVDRYVDRSRALLTPRAGPAVRSWLRLYPAFASWLREDLPAALRFVDRVVANPDATPTDLQQAAQFYLGLGRVRSAQVALGLVPPDGHATRDGQPDPGRAPARRGPTPHGLPLLGDDRETALAYAAYARGDGAGTRTWLSQASDRTSVGIGLHVWLLSKTGPPSEAAAVLSAWEATHQPMPMYRAQLALIARPGDQTIDAAMRELQKFPAGSGAFLRAEDEIASALESRGDVPRAIRLLERATESRRAYHLSGSAVVHWLTARRHLAALLRLAGRSVDADAIEAEVTRLEAYADPEFILLRK